MLSTLSFVTSDIHGQYDLLLTLLRLIEEYAKDLGCEDYTLHILGDLCDRGSESAKVFLEAMNNPHVKAIKGNHEVMAVAHLNKLLEAYHGYGIELYALQSNRDASLWYYCGGDKTVVSLFDEAPQTRLKIFKFVQSNVTMPYYRTLDINGIHYILVHGGFGNYEKGTRLEDIPLSDLVWSQPDFDGWYFSENTRVIVGHTPTFHLQKDPDPPRIYRGKGNVTCVDCGAGFPELGRLGCLCLETGEEFYV